MNSNVNAKNANSRVTHNRSNANRAFIRHAMTAVCTLLCTQIAAAGGDKSDTVSRAIKSRIERLGGKMPLIAVGAKRLTVVQEFISAALAMTKFLNVDIDEFYHRSISSAFSDAFRIATCDKVLGGVLVALKETSDANTRDLIIRGMVVSVDQYISLMLSVVPLAYTRTRGIGLWMMERQNPKGRPLQYLLQDIERMKDLVPHLPKRKAAELEQAIRVASMAFFVRSMSPLTINQENPRDVVEGYWAQADVIKKMHAEGMIGKVHEFEPSNADMSLPVDESGNEPELVQGDLGIDPGVYAEVGGEGIDGEDNADFVDVSQSRELEDAGTPEFGQPT